MAWSIDISLEKVQPFAFGKLDRYAIMRYLVSLHLYDRAQPLWDNYLDPAVRELGLDQNMPAEEALPAIHAAGGVTSLAHFHKNIGLKGLSRAEQEAAIARLHALGLDGMERWYPNYTAEDSAFAAHMIEKYGLLVTGGTDFHGSNRPQIEMGHGIAGNMAIPYARTWPAEEGAIHAAGGVTSLAHFHKRLKGLLRACTHWGSTAWSAGTRTTRRRTAPLPRR